MERSWRRRAVNGLRLLVIVLAACWAWQGPTRGHADKKAPLKWGWSLFRGQGLEACDVRFYERVDGEERYVERWRLFGYDAPRHMPKKLRVIGPTQLRSHVSAVCRQLRERRGGEVDVRAVLRCPSRATWKVIEDSPANICDLEYLRDHDKLSPRKRRKTKKRTSARSRKRKNKRERERSSARAKISEKDNDAVNERPSEERPTDLPEATETTK